MTDRYQATPVAPKDLAARLREAEDADPTEPASEAMTIICAALWAVSGDGPWENAEAWAEDPRSGEFHQLAVRHTKRQARAVLAAMEREPLDTAPPTWLVCVEGSDYGQIYSIHTDKAEAEEVAKKLSHQFPECYVSAPPMMTLDIPVPDEGETFFWVGDGLDDWEPTPLTEWRADDGFEDFVDYGKALQRDIADGLVVSAPTAEEATRRAAARGAAL